MPEMISYIVTETREVKVTANSAVDAARIAQKAFNEGQNSRHGLKTKDGLDGVWGDTTSKVRQLEINTKEVRYG